MPKRNKNYRYGDILSYNVSAQMRYASEIRELIKPMGEETESKIKMLFSRPKSLEFKEQQVRAAVMDFSISEEANNLLRRLQRKFENIFSKYAPGAAKRMVSDAEKSSAVALTRSVKKLTEAITVKMDFIPPGLKPIAEGLIFENVSLIKTIPSTYFNEITSVVMRSITTGMGMDELVNYLHKYYGKADNKALNVAADQSRKAYNVINKQRMLAVGYREFEWVHSGGGLHPRPDHVAMNGKIYSLDNLPVIDKRTGERGLPGQAINCGCTMRMVYRLENGEII